jgi:uncharacterized protein
MDLLSRAASEFAARPFVPHPLFKGGHAQTLAAYAWPRRHQLRNESYEERLFTVAPGVKILAHCQWQKSPSSHPTILIWHGMEGSSSSVYMLSMAKKGFQSGFNVLRFNLRNCGGTEYLTPTLYHGGLSEDLQAVVSELIEVDRLNKLFVVGFSLGGNMVLKLAGEYGGQAPDEIVAICAVSPSVDLNACAESISLRSNWIYERNFLQGLRSRIRRKQKLYPGLYDTDGLDQVFTLRDFDDRYTSRAHGFEGVDDYYQRASSIRVIEHIRIPTLIIHAEDDPFIPFAPLRDPVFGANRNILMLAPRHGGHVGFVAARGINNHSEIEDRFWAENRVLEFCRLACDS